MMKTIPVFSPDLGIDTIRHLSETLEIGWLGMGKVTKEFEERIRETKKKAIAENIEKAKEHNNVLTQTMDDEGNLIGVKETVDFESREVADAESTKLHNEMLISNANNATDEDSLEKVD